jgi:subtilisin family serine protease
MFNINKIKLILVPFLLIYLSLQVLAQNQDIIIKLKKNTPQNIITDFKNGFHSSGNNSLSKLCKNLNVTASKYIFKQFESSKKINFSNSGLDRIILLTINDGNSKNALNLLTSNEYIEYAELNYILKLENNSSNIFIPNDPFYQHQYFLPLTGLPDLWNISSCDSTILIGVVDSGLDFFHPDLQKSFFINWGEYGNGKESNGIDDDGNGFIDDWRGWDFVDEPNTGDPRRGDYLIPDNDPTDDNKFSHGTGVTGIINATINNGIGISSVAPGSKVLVLRAFDAEGFGEEDDVSAAILYGISMGVKIFNFSFGDYTYSNLLRDVIQFAYLQNIFISCSAGNDASFRLHYPSSFDEVTSVAASDGQDFKASFSSYGTTVDIYAPGYQILSSTRIGKGNAQFGGDYDYMNGTSFSAPIISGVAAHILKQNPNLKPEEVRGILISSTSYMNGQTNWDFYHSSGRVNAFNSFNNLRIPSIVRIISPCQDFSTDKDTIPICISAASPLFSSYSIFYGTGIYPENMAQVMANVGNQVLSDTVFEWNISGLQDTSYTLSLVINQQNGKKLEHNLVFYKDKNSPQIIDYSFGSLIDKNNHTEIIEFSTNKKTLGKIYFKKRNSSDPYQFIYADGGTNNIGLISTYHSGFLKSADLSPQTEYEFYLEAISLNGKNIILANADFHFKTGNEINSYGYLRKNYSLPSMQLCDKVVTQQNSTEIIFGNEIKNNYKPAVYSFTNGYFLKISANQWSDFVIVRDVADINSDSKYEMLASKSRNGLLFKAPANEQLPSVLIWSDTLNNNFWSSKFTDTDRDSLKEIIGYGKTGLRILENTGNNNFTEIANLPYEGGITSEPNSQNVLIDDFDNDGNLEIVFTNLIYNNPNSAFPNTVLQIYKCIANNTYSKVFSTILNMFIKGENLTEGDYDGDGKKEIAVGTVTNDDNPSQYYSLFVFKFQNGTYNLIGNTNIYNYKSYLETSTKSGNLDNDTKDGIFVNVGTHFYVLKYDALEQNFKPEFYLKDINSFNQIIHDFDKNGINEIGLNTIKDSLFFFEKDIYSSGPQTPLNFKVYSTDSDKVFLSFDAVIGADYYKIYRSNFDSLHYTVIDSISGNTYTDLNLLNNKIYFYFVTAVDTNLLIKESQPADYKKIYTHNKSKLVSASYIGNGFLSVRFSGRVSYSLPEVNTFILSNSLGFPKNIAFKSDYEYLLSFGHRIANGSYSILSKNLFDFYGSPVDSNLVFFPVNQVDSQKFYLQNLSLFGKYRLRVVFNLPVDSVTVMNPDNFIFEPFYQKVISIEIDKSNNSVIFVNLENKGYIGASGRNYILRIYNIYSQSGIKIVDGAGSFLGLVFSKENLDEVTVYPNPYKINSGKNIITFANLTPITTINIYDLTGKFIAEINESGTDGGADWNLKDSNGNIIQSGIYIYRVSGKDSNGNDVKDKMGKFAIIK